MQWLPMKPDPPVTRIVLISASPVLGNSITRLRQRDSNQTMRACARIVYSNGTSESPLDQSAAMRVAITALMPAVFVPVAMMIAIVIALSRRDDAAENQANQPQNKCASGNALCMSHGIILCSKCGQTILC